ncbi:MAG: hypothetical protein L0Y66_27145 [Myxococcaceae bacterium]|nr:hypothetical protein [Myxococcaceae bacterium]MCI0669874.1 hypothetical protein [Myxococcaceae bacterium]
MPAALLLTVLAAAPLGGAASLPRARPYDVGHYRIELRIEPDGAFEGHVDIRLTPKGAAGVVELDASGLDVTGVQLADGGKVSFTHAEDPATRAGLLKVRSARPLRGGQETTLRVDYRGRAGAEQEGLFWVERASGEEPGRSFFTHLQRSGARRLFPCNDRPEDKATTEVFAVVSAHHRVLGNGRRLLDEAFSEGGRALRRVHWLQDTPHSPDRVALAIGPFEEVEVAGPVPAALHVSPGTAERAFFARGATARALSFQSEFLGTRFPASRYDQVAVPRSLHDGAEGTGLALLREEGLLLDGGAVDFTHRPGQAELIARALADQWFGGLVGIRGREGAWLEEGLAAYLAQLTVDDLVEGERARLVRAERTFATRPHPGPELAAPEASTRGMMVVRMLEEWLGRERLRQGLKAFLESHANGSATADELFASVGRATGTEKELRSFRESWMRKKGDPILVPETSWDGRTLSVTLTQRPRLAGEKGPFVFKLPVVFHRDSSPTYHREEVILVDRPVVRARFELPAPPHWVNWNRDGAALARIHTPAVGEEQWTRAARHDPDPVWRLLAADALLGELVSPDAAELLPPTGAAVEALREVLERDPSPAVRESVLRRMGQARWRRLPGDLGPTVLALAKRPEHLPEDPIGLVRVRGAALALLGKLDFAEGHAYLMTHVDRDDPDVNTLEGWTTGVARLGDSEALAGLRAAVFAQRRRSDAHFRTAAASLGAFPSPEVLPVLKEVLAGEEGNAGLASALLERLAQNPELLSRPELATFVADFAVTQRGWGDDVRSRMVGLLEEVRTPEVRAALERIAASEAGDRLTAGARQALRRNFPQPPSRVRTTSTRR